MINTYTEGPIKFRSTVRRLGSISFYSLQEIHKSSQLVPPILCSITRTGENFKYIRSQNFVHILREEIYSE